MDRKALLKQIEDLKAKVDEIDKEELSALRQKAGELGYDLVLRGGPLRRGRKPRDPNAPKRQYSSTPESKIAATEKRSFTRAKNSGASDADAKKAGKAAAKALAEKLGVKV